MNVGQQIPYGRHPLKPHHKYDKSSLQIPIYTATLPSWFNPSILDIVLVSKAPLTQVAKTSALNCGSLT
jgi:hypothetical protein